MISLPEEPIKFPEKDYELIRRISQGERDRLKGKLEFCLINDGELSWGDKEARRTFEVGVENYLRRLARICPDEAREYQRRFKEKGYNVPPSSERRF